MVPLPHAKDNDQLENARRLDAAGGCWCMPQDTLTTETLSVQVRKLFEDPSGLVSAAQQALALANYRAVENLAELIEELADRQVTASSAA